MGALRQSRSFKNDMSPSPGYANSNNPSGYPSGMYTPSVDQGLPTLIVMCLVLFIIVLFCMWGAPGVKTFCRRKVFWCCPVSEPNLDSVTEDGEPGEPTIILLPYGRMVVVDSNLIAQLQTDNSGIDLMELGLNLMRAQMLQDGSSTSILDSGSTSKRMSTTSLDFLPPSYEEIFGSKANGDLPPSYSEVSMMLMLRNLAQSGFEYTACGRRTADDSVSVDIHEDSEETEVN